VVAIGEPITYLLTTPSICWTCELAWDGVKPSAGFTADSRSIISGIESPALHFGFRQAQCFSIEL
jgi:hypothetical protein